MNEQTKAHLKDRTSWLRVLYMLLFVMLYGVAEVVLTAVVLFQVVLNLFTGTINERLRTFGKQLSQYLYAILLYLTFNSETRPFPFTDWPAADAGSAHGTAVTSPDSH